MTESQTIPATQAFFGQALTGETNPADLLLVEALRAFYPEIYEIVRDNHSEFSGLKNKWLQHAGEDRSAKLLKPILEMMHEEHADAVKSLLIGLFPRLEAVYANVSYDDEFLTRWSREKRISSPQYCLRYFTYTVPLNDVPDAFVTNLLDAAMKQDDASVEAFLTSNLTGSKTRRLIEKLRAIEAKVDPLAAEMLALVLDKCGRNIPNVPALWSFAEPPSQAGILISHLLRRIPDRTRRIAAAERVIDAADPLWFGAECLGWLYVTDKPEKQDSNTLTEQEEAAVRQVLMKRIKASAANGAPLFDPDLPQERKLLFEWWRAEGRDPVQAHIVGVFTKEPMQVARFLQSQAPLAWSGNDALPHVGELGADQLKNIRLIIDLDTMAEWIRKHCPGDFNNPKWFPNEAEPLEQRLAEQFMFMHNKWKNEAEPADTSGCNEEDRRN